MLSTVRFLLILMVGLIIPFEVPADIGDSSNVKIELIQEEETIRPGQPFWVALRLNLEKDWHVYWKNPGDAGIPLKVEWNLPEGFEAGPLQWPFPEKFTVSEMIGFGYNGEVTLLSQIIPPPQLTTTELSIQAQVKWLVCSAITCQPGSASVALPLAVSSAKPQLRAEFASFFELARTKIPKTQVKVKTIRKHGIVQLQVPDASNSTDETIQSVYFFPEQKDVIDSTIDPTVDSNLNRYLVNLKGSDEIGATTKTLKGVLVLHTQKGMQENYQAFDIDSPIEEDKKDQEMMSFLDTPKTNPSFVGNGNISPSSSYTELGWALIFAFVGGMILNLMPCVLPVMSFKVMSFVKMSGQSRSLTFKHGLMFSFGVILSFWMLASVMLLLRAYGQAVGWGFQLQEPLFVVILASILFVFALSLFDLFEWGMFFASWAGQTQAETTQKSSGYMGSFLSGVLATAVATPCTGPFLGSAVGFAFTIPVYQSLLVFTVLALGMCFPYLLLAAFPSFLRFIPKPGPWMETFKQLMGFVLLATVLWLLWVFSAQTDNFSLMCLLVGFLCFAIGAWIYGRGCHPAATRKKRIFSCVFVLLFAFIGIEAILFPRASWYQELNAQTVKKEWDGWEEFSPERVAQLRQEGKPILIDFTAKWCLICQANHLVLDSDNVKKELDQVGVVKMKADWTKNDPVITEALSKFGRNSVPLYVLYGPDEKQEPVILPQVLTTDVVLEHLNTSSVDEIALK